MFELMVEIESPMDFYDLSEAVLYVRAEELEEGIDEELECMAESKRSSKSEGAKMMVEATLSSLSELNSQTMLAMLVHESQLNR